MSSLKIKLKEWGLAFVLALIFALGIKAFVFQSYMVASNHMVGSMYAGERVFVNKLAYGPRLPMTLLSVPFLDHVYSEALVLPAIRLKTAAIKANDVIAFNKPTFFDPPIDKKEVCFSRCVALPGDTLIISNKQLLVNGKKKEFPEHARFCYRLVTNGDLIDVEFKEKHNLVGGGLVSDIGIYDFALNKEQVQAIEDEEIVQYLREMKHFPREKVNYIFPMGSYYSWNKDYFGEVVIPYKGQTVVLNYKTIELYYDIITEYEGNTLRKDGMKVYLNDKLATKYTIKKNYYFVLDDNRDFANDSRKWGFLPEDHIIGKVGFIWLPYNKSFKQFNWDRMFLRVNK